MTRLTFGFILFGILSFVFLATPADAGVPIPSGINDDIIEPEKTELSAQRDDLLVHRMQEGVTDWAIDVNIDAAFHSRHKQRDKEGVARKSIWPDLGDIALY